MSVQVLTCPSTQMEVPVDCPGCYNTDECWDPRQPQALLDLLPHAQRTTVTGQETEISPSMEV